MPLRLPDWFKRKTDGGSCTNSDDEFSLSTKFEFFNVRTDDHGQQQQSAEPVPSYRLVENEVNLDEISSILKSKFDSLEAVAAALDGCTVTISEDLIQRVLQRFGNDWVASFGFFIWSGVGHPHSPESYNKMVDILGKFKQFDLMWNLIVSMAKMPNLVSLTTMKKVMRRLACAGKWNAAIQVFNNMEEQLGVARDTKAMNVLLDALCKERSVRHASDVFQQLRGTIEPDASSFNSLVHGWCKARKMNKAREMMDDMREHGYDPCVITYTSLIEAYCLQKNFKLARCLLDEMWRRQCPPNIVTYTIVMHSLGKADRIDEAFEIFDRIKQDGCEIDVSFYNSLIFILSQAGKLQEAVAVFDKMREVGVEPDVGTYNTLISALCRRRLAEDALKLLADMDVNEFSCGRPNTKTYVPLLKLCCRKQWVKMVLFLIAHMLRKDVGLDFGIYTLLVNWLCRYGKLAQSCLFLEEMTSKGFIPRRQTVELVMAELGRRQMHSTRKKIQLLTSKISADSGNRRSDCNV